MGYKLKEKKKRTEKGLAFDLGLAIGPDSMSNIAERRRRRRTNRRRSRMGRGLVGDDCLPCAPDIHFQFADFTSEGLETGGRLEPEQGPRRGKKRRRRKSPLFTTKTIVAEVPHDTGPTETRHDTGLLIPKELSGRTEELKSGKDALKALFMTDLAQLPPDVQQFALRELEKAEVGDQLSPETIREVARVAHACSILVKTPDIRKSEGFREDLLTVKKSDAELQIVWAEVYIPGLPDSQGDLMTDIEIQKAAYNFMAKSRLDQIDRMHDGKECGAYVVESFIAREGDDIFIQGAWVVGVHIPDPEIWAAVKSGEFNGFSMEGEAIRTEKQFELDLPEEASGRTEAENNHTHSFTVRFGDQGQFLGGETSTDADPTAPGDLHAHGIQKGTVTESTGANPHVHRYSVSEAILEVAIGRVPPPDDVISDLGYATS